MEDIRAGIYELKGLREIEDLDAEELNAFMKHGLGVCKELSESDGIAGVEACALEEDCNKM